MAQLVGMPGRGLTFVGTDHEWEAFQRSVDRATVPRPGRFSLAGAYRGVPLGVLTIDACARPDRHYGSPCVPTNIVLGDE